MIFTSTGLIMVAPLWTMAKVINRCSGEEVDPVEGNLSFRIVHSLTHAVQKTCQMVYTTTIAGISLQIAVQKSFGQKVEIMDNSVGLLVCALAVDTIAQSAMTLLKIFSQPVAASELVEV